MLLYYAFKSSITIYSIQDENNFCFILWNFGNIIVTETEHCCVINYSDHRSHQI